MTFALRRDSRLPLFLPLLLLVPGSAFCAPLVSHERLIPLVVLPGTVCLLLSFLTGKVGTWLRLAFKLYAGWLMASLAVERVLTLVFGYPFHGFGPLFFASLPATALIIYLLARRIASEPGTPPTGETCWFLASLSSAALVVLLLGFMVVYAIPVAGWIMGEGERAAAREYGRGVSRASVGVCYGVMAPLAMLVASIAAFTNRVALRDRQANKLAHPSRLSPVTAIAIILLVFFLVELQECAGH
jgi:hypothetical protein